MDFDVKLASPYTAHPKTSKEARELKDCISHRRDPYREKHIVHPESRAGKFNVEAATLYQLKTGPRAKRFLGSNVVNFADLGGTDQTYIAAEAPYHVDDYYRMIVDTGARTLVSLTGDKDAYKFRRGYPVNAHHLDIGDGMHIDGTGLLRKKGGVDIKCIAETQFKSPYPDTSPIIVRRYMVQKPETTPYEVHHILFKDWKDHGSTKKPNDTLALIAAADASQQVVGGSPIAVNCGYGQGRTNAFILMHQMKHLMDNAVDKLIPPEAPESRLTVLKTVQNMLEQNPQKVNVQSFIDATQARVMPLEDAQPPMLRAFPALMIKAEIERAEREPFAQETVSQKIHSHLAQVKASSPDKTRLR